MDVEIVERKENKLIGREEIKAIIYHPGEATPKREDVRKKIAAIIGKPIEVVILRKVVSVFGKPQSVAKIHVYNSKEDALKWEPKHILIRNGLIEKGE